MLWILNSRLGISTLPKPHRNHCTLNILTPLHSYLPDFWGEFKCHCFCCFSKRHLFLWLLWGFCFISCIWMWYTYLSFLFFVFCFFFNSICLVVCELCGSIGWYLTLIWLKFLHHYCLKNFFCSFFFFSLSCFHMCILNLLQFPHRSWMFWCFSFYFLSFFFFVCFFSFGSFY